MCKGQSLFLIQFWYLRCCGCPWNGGRQHLATPLKTCHNTEAGFLQDGCSAYPPTQRWRHLRLRRSRTWAVWLPLSPQLGDHPPSHDDNFVKCQMILLLTNMASGYAFQFQGMQSSIFRASTQTQKWEDCDWKGIWDKKIPWDVWLVSL